jgi:tetrahydromethanopterin S-methyltransferase subunit G
MLLSSLNPMNDSVDNAWIKEVNKRKDELENGKVTPVNGDEVFRKIQQRFNK